MSDDLERQLRERLRRADLPRAPESIRVSLDSVVRTPAERSDRRDRRRTLRLLAVAALLATGGLMVLIVGGGPQRNMAFDPIPGESLTPPSRSPTASARASPAPPPSPTGEVQWTRLAMIPPTSDRAAAHIVSFRGGYVIADGTRTVQVSPDGVTWTPVDLPLDEGTFVAVRSLASNGDRVVAVGGYSPCQAWSWEDHAPADRCRMRPASWTSGDGHTWQRSGPWGEAVAPKDWFGSMFTTMWTVPAGGWDAAQSFWSYNEGDGVGPALLHSDDGLEWTLLRALPAEQALPGSVCLPYWVAEHLRALADSAGRRVAREGSECDNGFISVSSDGRTYERLDGLAAASFWDGLAPQGSEPWTFIGAGPGSPGQPTASVSRDLRAWTSADLPVPPGVDYFVSSIERTGTRLVATGRTDPETGQDRLITWLSDDGITWRLADERADDGNGIEDIANGPGGVLGVSLVPVTDDASRLDVYRLDEVR